MIEETDTPTGGESLSIDQAAAAFVKATAPKEVPTDQTEGEEETASDDTTDVELQADDTASEEGDGDTDDPDQADDDVEPDSEQGRFVADNARVRITNEDGTTGYTTVAELKLGNLRNADATKKWQEAADIRRTAETQSATLKQREQQLEQSAKLVTDLVRAVVGEAPDPSMMQTDPMGYLQMKENREQWVNYLQHLQGITSEAEQKRQAEAESTDREISNREWDTLLGKRPELGEPKKAKAFAESLMTYAMQQGLTPEQARREIGLSHAKALIVEKAMKWDRLQASKGTVQKKVEGRPPVTKGGKRLNPSEHKARAGSEALARLQKSGTIDDAVGAYLATRK